MITVMHVIESLVDSGGTPRKLFYLAKYHSDRNVKLVFFCYSASPWSAAFEECGAEVIRRDTINPISLIKFLRHEIKKKQVDVLCTHFSRPLVVGCAAAKLTDIPFIHNEHSSAAYRQGMARNLAKMCLPEAQAVLCNSYYTRESIQKTYKIPNERLHVVYNPVDCREVRSTREQVREELGFSLNQPLIGHVGRMIESRDQANLLRAFHKLLTRCPSAGLVLIGDGPLRCDLEKLATDMGIKSAVRFLGNTTRVGDYLQAMDIYVNSTLDEGFGIAVVEAMLAGLPVILANCGAHPELVRDGKDGVLYTGGNVTALCESLEELIVDSKRRSALANRARERAQTFTPGRYAEGYNEVIKAVLEEKRFAIG